MESIILREQKGENEYSFHYRIQRLDELMNIRIALQAQ